jgi:hypothetical protein
MRLVFGIILGVLITIGAAYVHDSSATGPGPDTEDRRMVNWDVVHKDFRDLGAKLSAEWNRLTGHLGDKT